MNAKQFRQEVKRTLVRAVRSNFTIDHAESDEREQLESAPMPITDPIVQDYVVWRKAMLWVSAVALLILVILQIDAYQGFAEALAEGQVEAEPAWEQLTEEEQEQFYEATLESTRSLLGEENVDIIDGIQATYLLAQVAGTVLVWIAAVRWRRLVSSKRLARWGWAVIFVTPFVLSALPVIEMLDLDGMEDTQRDQLKAALGILFALGYFMVVGPKAISLFPGIMRSSMTLKTLLPESSAPGWAAILSAPLYSIFMLMVASTVIQIQGSPMLLLGILFLMAAPLIYLVRAKMVLAPRHADEVSGFVNGVRRIGGICNGIGAVCIAIFMLNSDMFGFDQAVQFALGVMAGVALLTVVASDLVLALLWTSYMQSKAFQGTPLQADLERKFEALSAVGLTNLAARGVAGSRAGAATAAGNSGMSDRTQVPQGPHEQAVAADSDAVPDVSRE